MPDTDDNNGGWRALLGPPPDSEHQDMVQAMLNALAQLGRIEVNYWRRRAPAPNHRDLVADIEVLTTERHVRDLASRVSDDVLHCILIEDVVPGWQRAPTRQVLRTLEDARALLVDGSMDELSDPVFESTLGFLVDFQVEANPTAVVTKATTAKAWGVAFKTLEDQFRIRRSRGVSWSRIRERVPRGRRRASNAVMRRRPV